MNSRRSAGSGRGPADNVSPQSCCQATISVDVQGAPHWMQRPPGPRHATRNVPCDPTGARVRVCVTLRSGGSSTSTTPGQKANCRHNDWRSAARPRRSAATEGLVSCNGRVMRRAHSCGCPTSSQSLGFTTSRCSYERDTCFNGVRLSAATCVLPDRAVCSLAGAPSGVPLRALLQHESAAIVVRNAQLRAREAYP
jgi:hypothetical protein